MNVDQSLLDRALGPGHELAAAPVVGNNLDPKRGEEALVITHRQGKRYQAAVLTSTAQKLAQAPIGGKILPNASIGRIGRLKPLELPGAGDHVYMLPVETTVFQHNRPVCGILVLRYRHETLSVIGELGISCWRKSGVEPFDRLEIKRSGKQVNVVAEQDRRERTYRWDPQMQSFVQAESGGG
jgi:hypothetical protein